MKTILSDGLRLAYQIDGPDDKPALVLINSLGTDLHMWDAQAEQLRQALRIIRFDNRGHGSSQVPTGACNIEQYGQDVVRLLDTLNIAQAHLCGLSLGGVIAQWCAIYHPARFLSATFANTAARIGNTEIWDTRIAAVQNGGLAAIYEAVLARFLSEDYRSAHPADTRRLGEMLLSTNANGYIAACQALREADLRARVSGIALPTLIIGGELDESTPPAQAHELHAAITGSKLHIFPATAHLSNIEHPAEFSRILQTFIEQV